MKNEWLKKKNTDSTLWRTISWGPTPISFDVTGPGTLISSVCTGTLPGAQNLGEIDDVTYFRNKLFTPLMLPKNFPSDDANTLQQLSDGSGLDLFYGSMYADQETLTQIKCSPSTLFEDKNEWFVTYSPMQHIPVIKGTVIGSIKAEGEVVQTFCFSSNGSFSFKEVVSNVPHMVSAGLNPTTGEISGYWNALVKNTEIVVSYEYSRS